MARAIARFAFPPLRRDALSPLRALVVGSCALALIFAGQPLPF